MSEPARVGPRRSLTPLWWMIAIFLAPITAAWFFYLNPEFLPSGRSNKGELIEPVVALHAEPLLRGTDGAAFNPDALNGKWTLVYLSGGECGKDCLARLVDLRQIRLAVGESQLSVARVLILVDPAAPLDASDLGPGLDGTQVAVTDAAGGGRLLARLGEGPDALNRVYILDPMGNLMMRYGPDAPAEDTLKDMERLLKASKNWIKGAQYGHK